MEVLGLVSLVRLALIANILPLLITLFPIPGLGFVRRAMLEVSRRGKNLQSNYLTVPQRFFSHYYVMASCWTTILLTTMWYYAINILVEQDLFSGGSHEHKSVSMREHDHVYNVWRSVFLLLLMEVQVLRRFYESYFVFKYSPSARLYIIGYLSGLLYYTVAPLSLCCTYVPEAFDFLKNFLVVLEGSDRVSRPGFSIRMLVAPLFRLRWYAWIGTVIFFWGWVHQYRCHVILGSLRKTPEKQGEYVIPYGDWFEYVSSPHYLAEIVVYSGLLLASGGADLSLWLLFVFVVANLVIAAIETQKWYFQKFDDYPRNRCAIFPFVY